MKLATILGARPQFIKASVVSHCFAQVGGINEVVVHTGQHFDANMSDVFFDELGIAAPQHQLDIHGGTHGAMTGRMLAEIEGILLDERPDAVLVYGDTNSTLAGALAAVKLHIPVAHVEAGLRSFNLAMPEEINRIVTDRVSRWLFTPTAIADANLTHEGVARDNIHCVGDVMFDVALHHGARAGLGTILDRLGLQSGTYVLTTVHRAENTEDTTRLRTIVSALTEVARERRVVWPLHPRTRAILDRMGLLKEVSDQLTLIEPVGYLDMVRLEKHAAVIATDSGGVQKEAFFHRVPCVTMREETEWTELIDGGWNHLAPATDKNYLVRAILDATDKLGCDIAPYGDGNAAAKIAKVFAQLNPVKDIG